MGYRYIARKLRERGGPIIGGTEWNIEVWDEQAMSTERDCFIDSAAALAAITQPMHANSGWQYLTTTQVLAADTTIQLESTVDIQRGDVFQLVDGAFVVVLTVKSVDSGVQITVFAAPGGAHTYAVGSTAGDPDNYGDIAFWTNDTSDPWISVTKVGSDIPSIPKQLHITQLGATLAFQEEGVSTGSARGTVNFTGPNVKAADDAGNARVNVDVDKQEDLGTVSSATPTWDWALAPNKKLILAVNITTLTLSNPQEGGWYHLHILQDATGGRTIAWPAAVNWGDPGAPDLGGANKVAKVTFHFIGTTYFGSWTVGY